MELCDNRCYHLFLQRCMLLTNTKLKVTCLCCHDKSEALWQGQSKLKQSVLSHQLNGFSIYSVFDHGHWLCHLLISGCFTNFTPWLLSNMILALERYKLILIRNIIANLWNVKEITPCYLFIFMYYFLRSSC